MFGFLCINKPVGLTSRQAVDVVKRLVKPAKTGHCGTLDPLASGLLVIGIGPATRLMKFAQECPKSYRGSFRLGVSSPTDDLEGELSGIVDAPRAERTELETILNEFVGTIDQKPPAYSAIKIDGQRAYRLSRSGREVQLQPRPVVVYRMELIRFDYPNFELEIRCGSGTYIRSIGRDIGERLNSAAIMTGLDRTSIGPFTLEQSVALDDLDRQAVQDHLIPPERIFEGLPRAVVSEDQLKALANGMFVDSRQAGIVDSADRAVAVDQQGRLLAVLARIGPGRFKPELNFVHYYQSLDVS